jgi:polyisoprenoid-binding protein YceI
MYIFKNKMKKIFYLFVFAMATLFLAVPMTSKAQAWGSDGVHSTVMYTVKHMVTPMIGVFKKFNVDINFDAAKPLETKINATLDASSVMMGMEKLEGHIKSETFFDVAKYPEWTFVSSSITKGKKSKEGASYIANGKLTVRGVTKDVAIPFLFLGTKESPYGVKAGFSAEFTINRLDYGVGQGDWAGTGVVASDVKVTVLLEMNAKK